MATTTTPAGRSGTRVRVQQFGTFLSNMVLPNIGAFIAWGLITALFIENGWINLGGGDNAWLSPGSWVAEFGGWGDFAGGGIVGPMITYLLPLLIGYTGGRMMYDNNIRGGVVGAIATMGAIAGAGVPMFLGAMIMGPLGGWSIKRLDALWTHKIRPGFEMLVNNFSAGIWGMILAIVGFVVAGPFVSWFSARAGEIIDFLVENSLLPLTSLFIEPAKVLFLNNAINQGILTPLGTAEASRDGQSILFLLEANPAAGAGLLLAFALFGKGAAKATAPGALLIHFVGGIHEIYFPYVLMKPKLILAMIAGGMTQIFINLAFSSGLRAPAAPGSIIAVLIATPGGSYVGVILSVIGGAAASFVVAAFLLKTDRAQDDGDLAGATASMESMKGKTSIASSALGTSAAGREVRSIVFACDAGMGSSAMGASVLRKKVRDAGHGEVTVVNKAISNLDDSYDVVVTHQDLTDRARRRTPSATHVSVDDFMASPRYDEIVAMLDRGPAGGAAVADETDGLSTADVLSRDSIVLSGSARTRDDAIAEAGGLLVAAGAVAASYVDAMHERERSVSTHMGNGLAIPHGTNDAKSSIHRSAMSFVRYPGGIDWSGKQAEFVVGIAGAGDDHLALLRKIATVFADESQVARLRAAASVDEVVAVLDGVSV